MRGCMTTAGKHKHDRRVCDPSALGAEFSTDKRRGQETMVFPFWQQGACCQPQDETVGTARFFADSALMPRSSG